MGLCSGHQACLLPLQSLYVGGVSVDLNLTQGFSLGALFSKVKLCCIELIPEWVTIYGKNSVLYSLGRQAGIVVIKFTIIVCGLSFSWSQLTQGFSLGLLFSKVKPCWRGLISGWVTVWEKFCAVLLLKSGWCCDYQRRVVYDHCIWAEFRSISTWLPPVSSLIKKLTLVMLDYY